MSNIVLQLVLVFMCIFTKTFAEVVCDNPIEIGELRVFKSKVCVDISGNSGGGNVLTYECEGLNDQQIIMCGDGTIRSTQASYMCLTPEADGNLVATTCEVYPDIPEYQKWRFGRSKDFVDNGGIHQDAREIINLESGLCVDVAGDSGEGNMLTSSCGNSDDQYFYFRSRGKLLEYGRLQNEKSGLCLDVSGNTGGHEDGDNVLIYDCVDALDTYFSFYENGELINKKSGLCVDVSGDQGSGNILMWSCTDVADQMWSQPIQYCDGDYCSFRNKKSGNCMDVSGSEATSGSNVLAYDCAGAPDQGFRWLNDKWITPTATWSLVGCNQDGKISQKLSNTVSYSSKISESMAAEISSTIESDVIFASVSVTATISNTLAMEWERGQSETREVTFTCEMYDTGKPFTRGCMWQLQLTTQEATKVDVLTWSPMIIKCTSSNEEPHCPPFTKCVDDECTMCEEMPGAHEKRTVGKPLTWEEVLKVE